MNDFPTPLLTVEAMFFKSITKTYPTRLCPSMASHPSPIEATHSTRQHTIIVRFSNLLTSQGDKKFATSAVAPEINTITPESHSIRVV